MGSPRLATGSAAPPPLPLAGEATPFPSRIISTHSSRHSLIYPFPRSGSSARLSWSSDEEEDEAVLGTPPSLHIRGPAAPIRVQDLDRRAQDGRIDAAIISQRCALPLGC